MSKEILDKCLSITGSFENGNPSYTSITGHSDGQGLSCGVLQWCAGQGSLGTLINKMISLSSKEFVDSHFPGIPVSSLIKMNGQAQKSFVLKHFIKSGLNPSNQAKQQWASLLGSDIGIQAQVSLAEETVLSKAKKLAQDFCPNYPNHLRCIAFFFDIVTQSGGMSNNRGRVEPISEDKVDPTSALEFMNSTPAFVKNLGPVDGLSGLLLHYAYERAKLCRPQYIWDAFSRRATIACRGGFVHGKKFNLVNILP
jgi:hypothetical protein